MKPPSNPAAPAAPARRTLLRQASSLGLLGAAGSLGGCAGWGAPGTTSGRGPRARLAPMRVTPDQLVDAKCCLRPLRAAGPNLGTEWVGDTLVVHNYGHGGSGWSLSWGSAEIAVGKALSVLPTQLAVVGCGIIGLTTAVVAQRAGLAVTVYARDPIQRTRSFRASGSFTPDSRIALAEPAGPAFGDLWEQMARHSWKAFRTLLGLPGQPVEFVDAYALWDEAPQPRRPSLRDAAVGQWVPGGLPRQNAEFGHYGERLRDLVPQARPLARSEHPFPVAHVTRSAHLHFNFTAYAQTLQAEFFARGGRYVARDFHSPAEYAGLPEKVVVNATGYAARDLWGDTTVIPVRGQTGWLVPQPAARYSVRYRGVSLTAKSDGIAVMNNPVDAGEMFGVGDTLELPDRAPLLAALRVMEPVMAAVAGGGDA